MATKQCIECGIDKPTNEFNKRQGKCKSCQKTYAANYNLNDWNIRYQGIYSISDSETGRCLYIGASDGINRRISRHKTNINNLQYAEKWHKSQLNLYTSLSQHKSVFFEVLEECSKELLKEREIHYINQLKPLYNIYNND